MNLRCVVSGLLAFVFAATALAASSSGGSCKQTPQSTPDQVVDVPNYRDADSAPDPEVAAAESDWQRYQSSMIQSLRDSTNPRDWAIAVMLGSSEGKSESSPLDSGLMDRAAAAAPDDVLVQWLALGHQRNDSDRIHSAPLHALRALEPDNAAIWLVSLNRAAQAKDATGVEVALERMADSKRFDTHYFQVARAIADATLKFALPQDVLDNMGMAHDPDARRTYAEVMGVAYAAATVMPAFQSLTRVCTVDAKTGANVLHTADCARIGQLFIEHSPTLLANHIGFALLRLSHTWTDADVQAARRMNWVFEQYSVLLTADESTLEPSEYLQGIYATGNELEAARLAVERAGKPTQPPADWVDKRSPFSAERLANDARRAADYADGPFY